MGLIRWAVAGAAGYFLYNKFGKSSDQKTHAAFADGEPDGKNFAQVRSAGAEGMRSDPPEWDKTDQAVDESFPASDPPATY